MSKNISIRKMMEDSGVAVWGYGIQRFVEFIPVEGQKRVRIDVYDGLENYAVFKARYTRDRLYVDEPENPLTDWEISLT